VPDAIVVLHHEHGLAAPDHRRGRLGDLPVLRWLSHAGQIDPEGGATPRLAIDPDEALALLDDAVHRREAEPSALPLLLGGKEGVEDPRLGALVHPDAGVADG